MAESPGARQARDLAEHLAPGQEHEDYLMPPSPCPYCEVIMDGAMGVDAGQDPPKPGDFSTCMSCGQLSVYDPKLHLRRPSSEEISEFASLMGRLRSSQ